MQFFAGSPRSWARQLFPSDKVAAFNKLASDHELSPIFIHALYLLNLASGNKDLLIKSMDSLTIDMQNSELINAAGVIVHIGNYTLNFEDVKDDLVNRIFTLLSQAPTSTFIIENSAGQKGKIGTLEQIYQLVSELASPRVKICLDTAHLFASGHDISQPSGTDKLVDQLETLQLLPHLAVIHLNESRTPLNSHHDIHANLDQGMIGISGLKYFVTHPKLNHLPLILEVPGTGEPSKGPDAHNIALAKSFLA